MKTISGKKIMFLITKSNWGGAQSYVYTLATEMSAQGANVSVVTGGTGLPDAPAGLLAQKLESSGIPTTILSNFMRDISLHKEYQTFLELLRVMRLQYPDILHVNSSKAGGLGAFVGRIIGVKKIVFTAHGWAHREPRSRLKTALIWLASWLTVFLCHEVIVVSRKDYTDAPVFISRRKLHLIPNGIAPFEMLSTIEARYALLPERQDLMEKKWIVMQSELHPNKAVHLAIEALNAIKENCRDLILVVMGGGEEFFTLKSQVEQLNLSNRVFLLGFIQNSRSFLRAGDMFLLPSLKEGLPIALLEAGIAGLPSIGSATGGIPDVIIDGETGLTVTPGDVKSITKALESLYEKPAKAEEFGIALQKRIERHFSEKTMLIATAGVYINND